MARFLKLVRQVGSSTPAPLGPPDCPGCGACAGGWHEDECSSNLGGTYYSGNVLQDIRSWGDEDDT